MDINWLDILNTILVFVGTCGTAFLVWKACQKPKAKLRFSNGKKELTFSPHYYRAVSHKYYVDPPNDCYASHAYEVLLKQYNKKHENENKFILTFHIENTGELQLENYKVEISFDGGIKSFAPTVCKPRKVIGNYVEPFEPDDLQLNGKQPQIVFEPLDKSPLNQKDHKDFAVRFSPHPDIEHIELYWRIIAKDFNDQGKFVIHLKPIVTEYDEIHFANCDRDIPEGAEKIEDLTPYIQHFQDLLKNE